MESGEILGGKVMPELDDIYLNHFRLYDHFEVGNLTGRSAFVVRLLHNSGALRGTEDHLFSRKDILNAFKPLEGKVSALKLMIQDMLQDMLQQILTKMQV